VRKSQKKSSKFYKQRDAAFKNTGKKHDFHLMAYEISRMINHHFPDLHQKLSNIEDTRKIKQYQINEIIFGGIAMFLFKTGSRNNMNNFLKCNKFKANFYKLFKIWLPCMDNVALILKSLDTKELENLKKELITELITKRIFDKWRFAGKIVVSIDATGLVTFNEPHCDKCLTRTYKAKNKNDKDKIVYFHNVLEAKIVTPCGFSMSLSTIWIDNDPDNKQEDYDKQDCERKAFERLAEKIKKEYPRLEICLCADGLYPNNTFFEICTKNQWDYVVTLKDKSLKGLWKKIRLTNRDYIKIKGKKKSIEYIQEYQFINNIDHNNYRHNWIQTEQEEKNSKGKEQNYKFVHLTNIEINHQNAKGISETGRLRWKIENEGFNQQKRHGYNISHKYCRKSYTGLKNFYQCCQIAHIFNQLLEKSKNFKEKVIKKLTIKHIWVCIWGFMIYGDINSIMVEQILNHKTQVQYVV